MAKLTAYKILQDVGESRWLTRKLVLALIAAVVAFGNQYWDWSMNSEEVWQIIGPLLFWVGVEGIADIKERG